jgi:GntR family transcriptional repressor for pyruvate dehydrogenase complex
MPRKLTYEAVYDRIKAKIAKGEWKAGDRLPPIEQLSAEFKVGVSSVREAIRILGKQRILRVEQGRGTFVQSDIGDLPGDRIDFLENATMMQLLEARLVLEPELSAFAAERASDEEIRAISRNARSMKRKVEAGEDFLKEDIEFHDLIAQAARNEVLSHMLGRIADLLLDSRRRSMKWPGMDDKAAAFHLLIADAIARRNPPQARNLMKCHMEDMITAFQTTLQRGESG